MAKRKRRRLLGDDVRKIAPRLRMIADGDDEVNAVRAQTCAAIGLDPAARRARRPLVLRRDDAAVFQVPRKAALRVLPKRAKANVYITQCLREVMGGEPAGDLCSEGFEAAQGYLERIRRRGNIVAATVPLSALPDLARQKSVVSIELAEALRAPKPKLGQGAVAAPSAQLRRQVDDAGGAEALIGLVDVQGFDFAHQDFIDAAGRTRFLRIWDQAGSRRDHPKGFDYGSELTEAHLAAAMTQGKALGIAPASYEPQSSMDPGSHGTHVASIAAGNLGICHKAGIIAVLLSLGKEDEDRRSNFYDSTRLADAVDYLLRVAQALGKPISINVSLGTNGHAHDGSSAISRWIDSALAIPGRSVCVAAGNAGQEKGATEDDLGFVMGRIHTSGRITANGLSADIGWIVMGSGLYDVSENELEIWYSPADRFAVSVKPPGGEWTEEIEPGEYIENRQLEDGSFFSVYNELYMPSNGGNYIAVYLSPYLSESVVRGVKAGTWRIRLRGLEVRDGRFDGWIERDDPVRVGGSGPFWAFPSFFSEESNADRCSVSSLACGHNVIAVANLAAQQEEINITSSQGPTRDGRCKPEIAAPGTNVVAAAGFMTPDAPAWVEMSGTSMASPYVAGIVGLMLSRKRSLTAAQILGIIQRTARPLPGSDYSWRNDAGYGRLDPYACLEEAARFEKRTDRT